MAKYIKIDASIPQRIITLLKSSEKYLNEDDFDELTDNVFTDNEEDFTEVKESVRNSIIIKLLGGSLD
jgi:hypothetical protein